MKSKNLLKINISITFNLDTTTTDDRDRAIELMASALNQNFDFDQIDYGMTEPLDRAHCVSKGDRLMS